MKILKIYTDGAYKPSIKKGAASFIVLQDNQILCEASKVYQDSVPNTNNRMELEALINALNWVRSSGYSPKDYRFYVYTDSQYVQLGITNRLAKWKENGWKNSKNVTVKNQFLWHYIDSLLSNEFESIFINWIEGHNGDKWNVAVDELCKIALKHGKGENIKVQGSRLY